MPKINLIPKKKRIYNKNKKKESYKYVYNTTTWKKLRIEYLKEHPLCEICKEKGIITLAQEVHHRIPISMGNDMEEKKSIGFDYNNLQSLCTECHVNIHKKINGNKYENFFDE